MAAGVMLVAWAPSPGWYAAVERPALLALIHCFRPLGLSEHVKILRAQCAHLGPCLMSKASKMTQMVLERKAALETAPAKNKSEEKQAQANVEQRHGLGHKKVRWRRGRACRGAARAASAARSLHVRCAVGLFFSVQRVLSRPAGTT